MSENVKEELTQEQQLEVKRKRLAASVKTGKHIAIELEDILSGNTEDAIIHALAIVLVTLEKTTRNSRHAYVSLLREHMNIVSPDKHPCISIVEDIDKQAAIDILGDTLLIVDKDVKEIGEGTVLTRIDLKEFKVIENDLNIADEELNIIIDVYKALYLEFKNSQLANPEVKRQIEELEKQNNTDVEDLDKEDTSSTAESTD
jgi:hypothetical protein